MSILSFVIGLVIRLNFINTLSSLLSKISEKNRELSFGILWISFFPVLSLLTFPHVVNRLSVSLSFELSSLNIKTTTLNPTRTTGILYYMFGILSELFLLLGIYTEEYGLVLLGLVFALPTVVFFIIYWVQVAKYNSILKNHQQQNEQSALPEVNNEQV